MMKKTNGLMLATLLFTAALLWACSDNGAASTQNTGDAVTDASTMDAEGDAAEEVEQTPEGSTYTMKITMLDQETVYELDRDITGKESFFSFGSSHIGTAVAFSVTETITWPANMTITFDFGKVIGMLPDFPVQTYATGDYPFSSEPPAVEVFVEGFQYKSLVEGSEGMVIVTEWGPYTDDVIAGSYAGKLIQETGNVDKLSIDVEGTFRFILPEKRR